MQHRNDAGAGGSRKSDWLKIALAVALGLAWCWGGSALINHAYPTEDRL